MDEWFIKSDNMLCRYLIDGRCYHGENSSNEFVPPWCKKEICKIKIE